MNRINDLGSSSYFQENIYRFPHDNSIFDYDFTYNGSFMAGRLIPIGAPTPVLPNHWLSLDLNGVIRTGSALIAPILDNMYVDVVSVFVPWRIIWNHYPQWLGENDQTAFNQTNTYQIPNIDYYGGISMFPANSSNTCAGPGHLKSDTNYTLSSTSWSNYFLACHFGLAHQCYYQLIDDAYVSLRGYQITALEYRGYYAAWNEYFRDPDWQRPVLFSKTDTGESGEFGYTLDKFYLLDTNGTKTNSTLEGSTTWQTVGQSITNSAYAVLMPVNRFRDSYYSLKPKPQAGDGVTVDLSGLTDGLAKVGSVLTADKNSNPGYLTIGSGDFPGLTGKFITWGPGASGQSGFGKFVTDLNGVGLAINNLRAGVMLQNFQDVLIRGDQRAPHIIEQLFGITPEGLKCDRPLLLHHSRHLVGVNQVVATADSTAGAGVGTSRLGETGAYSVTTINTPLFTQRFSEHGFVYNFLCVRTLNKYYPAIPEQMRRVEKFDHFWPTFNDIGMVPFYATNVDNHALPGAILGYQDGHYPYKTQRSICVGALDARFSDSFSFWTVSPVISNTVASPNFIIERPDGLDRALLANHNVAPQFVSDIRISGKNGLPMSQHSLPVWLSGRF